MFIFIPVVYFYLVSSVWCSKYPSFNDIVVRKSSVYLTAEKLINGSNENGVSMSTPPPDTILISLNVDVIEPGNRLTPDGPKNDPTELHVLMETEKTSFILVVFSISFVILLPFIMIVIIILNDFASHGRRSKIEDTENDLKIYTFHIV